MRFDKEKNEIIFWAQLLNQRGYVTARGGNLSVKIEKNKVLITTHNCYLGFLQEDDIVLAGTENRASPGRKELSSERIMHLSIHKKFNDAGAVIHVHSPYTTAFFNYFDELEAFSFETKFYLGEVKAIEQNTPTVTEIEPVLHALENSKVVVLKNHGVVAIGDDFKEAFSFIELLEEQAKVNFAVKNVKPKEFQSKSIEQKQDKSDVKQKSKYKLLSKEHVEKLAELVNNDQEAQSLGKQYGLTCTLAVKNQDTNTAVCFCYEAGKIVKTSFSEDAEFVIIGKEDILKKVFNREIDPFVAATQGRVKTKGDFVKMSRWYPVLVKTFKIWELAPVE